MNEFFTSISQASTPLYYPPFKKRNHGQYYLYQPHRYVTSAPEPEAVEAETTAAPKGTQINDLYPEILAIVFSYLPVQDKGRYQTWLFTFPLIQHQALAFRPNPDSVRVLRVAWKPSKWRVTPQSRFKLKMAVKSYLNVSIIFICIII